jgi:hypothetical protein
MVEQLFILKGSFVDLLMGGGLRREVREGLRMALYSIVFNYFSFQEFGVSSR